MQKNKHYSAYFLQSLLATRVCVLAIALLVLSTYSSFYRAEIPNAIFAWRYSLLAYFFAFTALSCLWYILKGFSQRFLLIQFLSDIVLASFLIYFSGAAKSPFLFLYLILVLSSSLFSGFKLAMGAILLSVLGFIFVHMASVPETQDLKDSLFNPEILVELFALILGMFAAAFAPRFLSKHIKISEQAVAETEFKLSKAKAMQGNLLNQIPYAVIATDNHGLITHINRKACDLFSIAEADYLNLEFSSNFEVMSQHDSNVINVSNDTAVSVHHCKSKKIFNCRLIDKTLEPQLGVSSGRLYIWEPLEAVELIDQNVINLISNQIDFKQEVKELLPGFVAQSAVMHKIFSLIKKVARTDAAVLISGESGTGKELVARSIHQLSDRQTGKFVAINCAAIPEHLLESELFGHKKGAFTGAYQDRLGLFELAEAGTLFLDEIGELPLHMQSKLLRVLQEKTFRPIGSNQEKVLNIRLIAATNRSLSKEVANGNFREDLFYRINVVSITLPPLRERKEDLPILIDSILNKLNLNLADLSLTKENLNTLMNYNYPGNVRELENIIERALVMGDGQLNLDFLKVSSLTSEEKQETKIITLDQVTLPLDLDQLLNQLERLCLEQALSKSGGVKTKAAELLGLNLRSLRYRMEKFQMQT